MRRVTKSRKNSSTRASTTYLRGVTIIVVMVTHYSCGYANEFCMNWLRDYAGFWVSIFFALSGFGIYYSFQRLEAHFGTSELNLRLVGTFYWERALRIYPLFWLSVFTASFIMYGWADLHFLSVRTIAVYLTIPTVRGPGFIWFIPMLVQCYVLAPFLYFLLKFLRLKLFLVFVAALCAFFMLISYYYLHLLDLINGFGVPDPEALFYGPVFLANLLIFALGMTIPLLKDQLKPYLGVSAIVISAISFLTSMYLVRDPDLLFTRSHFFLFPLFIFSVFALCLSVITANRSLPLGRPVGYLGIYSYPLYLFHWHYFTLLALAGVIVTGRWWNGVATILIFPVFLICCVSLQKAADKLKIFGSISSRRLISHA